MLFGGWDMNVEDFEDNIWSKFDESEKFHKLRQYGMKFTFGIKTVSDNYLNRLRDYLNNYNHTFDAELIDSFSSGMFKTWIVREYLKKAICHASVSEREKILSHKLLSDEVKEELKKIVAAYSSTDNSLMSLDQSMNNAERSVSVEVHDSDFEIDNWGKFDCKEQRCKLILQGRKMQRVMDEYKYCLLKYLDSNSTCYGLIDTLPDTMLASIEFQEALKRLINRASDYERILLLYKFVDLKYGKNHNLKVKNYDLISLFNPDKHEGETVEFWSVYLFLKSGLEKNEKLKKKYFIQAHHSFKKVIEVTLQSWLENNKRSSKALKLLFPCCADKEHNNGSFQIFCDARLWVTKEDKEKYHHDSLATTGSVFCYRNRVRKSVMGLNLMKEVYAGRSRRGNIKKEWIEDIGCAHVRSLLHDPFYKKSHEVISPKEWTLFEFMDILNVPFYQVPGYTGNSRELYINKLASEFNWLFKIKNRLKCKECKEQMRFDFEFSKKGENFIDGADEDTRGLFAAYMNTRAHCTHGEKPHDIAVYLNHCIGCHSVIDSRYCNIFDGAHYLCRRCGSGHPSNTVPGTICPYCGSNKMKYVGYRKFECQNCEHEIEVENYTFKKFYTGIEIGGLAKSFASSSGNFSYTKNCAKVYDINCDTGIPLEDILDEPDDVEDSEIMEDFHFNEEDSFDREAPFDEEVPF